MVWTRENRYMLVIVHRPVYCSLEKDCWGLTFQRPQRWSSSVFFVLPSTLKMTAAEAVETLVTNSLSQDYSNPDDLLSLTWKVICFRFNDIQIYIDESTRIKMIKFLLHHTVWNVPFSFETQMVNWEITNESFRNGRMWMTFGSSFDLSLLTCLSANMVAVDTGMTDPREEWSYVTYP